jgi:tight adherence protein C
MNESATLFQNLGYGLVCLMVAYTVWTLVEPLLEGDKIKKRMDTVTGARETLRQQRFAELEKTTNLRVDGRGRVRDFVERFSLETLLASPEIKEKMSQAGIRGQKPLYYFYIARMFCPLAFGGIAIMLAVVLNLWELVLFQKLAVVLGAVAFGYYFPAIYVKNKAEKRLTKIMPVFPDALDLLLICVESGMSVEVAFAKVAEEMAESSIELAEEFSLTTAELSFLNSRRIAYENLARRNNHEGIRSVATALVQAERYGTPLGDTLRTLSHENRAMRVLAAEKKAAALPAKLTVPMMIFFLPVLFIVLLTPAAMRLMTAF